MAGIGDFLSGYTQVMGPEVLRQRQEAQNKEIKALQLKKYKAELDLMEKESNSAGVLLDLKKRSMENEFESQQKKTQAADQLASMLGGGRNLLDILSDPQGQMLALQSGMIDAGQMFKENRLKKQDEQLSAFLGGIGTGQGGGAQFSPESLFVAKATGDLKQLKPRNLATTTIEAADGPQVIQYDENDPTKQVIIGEAKQEKITPEQSGKLSSLKQTSNIAQLFRDQFINPDGSTSLDQLELLNLTLGTPGTDGALWRNRFTDAVDTVIKARTGAAATKEEMKVYMGSFMPKFGDTDKVIVDKINRLQQFVDGSLDFSSMPKSLQEKLKKRSPEKDSDSNSKRLEELLKKRQQ